MKLNFTFPCPPSLNKYYRKLRNRIIISNEGQAFLSHVALIVAGRNYSYRKEERLRMDVIVYAKTNRPYDLDNIFKSLCDSLEKTGVIVNDSQFDWLTILRGPKDKDRPRCEVTIQPLPST